MNFNERIKTETIDGKEIVTIDFSTLMADSLIEMIDVAHNYIKDKSDLLIIFDLTKASVFGEATTKAKEFAKVVKKHRKKAAFLGIKGAKSVILNSILLFAKSDRSKIKTCNSKEEAVAWLLS